MSNSVHPIRCIEIELRCTGFGAMLGGNLTRAMVATSRVGTMVIRRVAIVECTVTVGDKLGQRQERGIHDIR